MYPKKHLKGSMYVESSVRLSGTMHKIWLLYLFFHFRDVMVRKFLAHTNKYPKSTFLDLGDLKTSKPD